MPREVCGVAGIMSLHLLFQSLETASYLIVYKSEGEEKGVVWRVVVASSVLHLEIVLPSRTNSSHR